MSVEDFINYTDGGDNTNLTCQVIADSCDVLDEIINPEYQDTLYADDMTWSKFLFDTSYMFLIHKYHHQRSSYVTPSYSVLVLTSAFIILTMQSGFAMLEVSF